MNASHTIERDVYECECGAWWYGDEAPAGQTGKKAQECPQCGAKVDPETEVVD